MDQSTMRWVIYQQLIFIKAGSTYGGAWNSLPEELFTSGCVNHLTNEWRVVEVMIQSNKLYLYCLLPFELPQR